MPVVTDLLQKEGDFVVGKAWRMTVKGDNTFTLELWDTDGNYLLFDKDAYKKAMEELDAIRQSN